MSAPAANRTLQFQATDLAYVAVFAALTAALAIMPGFTIGPVPFVLTTIGVGLAGLCLGPVRGFAAVAVYVLVGIAGMPVFSKGTSGIGVILGPTGGYLIAFPLAAILTGFLAVLILRRGLSAMTPVLFFLALVAARYLIILPLGVGWLATATGMSMADALKVDMGFWLADGIKNVVAAALAFAVHKAFPRLLLQRR